MAFVQKHLKASLLAITFTLGAAQAHADNYSFNVHNTSDSAIKQILVSEDGNEYGYFDLGSGIKPGATVELVWDSSTNGENCAQYFKAVFADGSESEPAMFDFCEPDLTLEFN
ncbi:MAG: hypothetical protein LPK85_03195 [Gammaproteobacteria bacterium]|nr:hypothetical protein [Gammaproteobacteria bacterium]